MLRRGRGGYAEEPLTYLPKYDCAQAEERELSGYGTRQVEGMVLCRSLCVQGCLKREWSTEWEKIHAGTGDEEMTRFGSKVLGIILHHEGRARARRGGPRLEPCQARGKLWPAGHCIVQPRAFVGRPRQRRRAERDTRRRTSV